MKKQYNRRTMDAIDRRIKEARDRLDREREIARCECGAQVRLHPRLGWVHAGSCSITT